jgi:tryptophan halogenase
LWDYISNGYVYSEKFIDKEIALKEFKEHLNNTNQWCKDNDAEELEYRHINIRNGEHKKAWHKNCIAIGLSYGFIEPLESSGLGIVTATIHHLMFSLLTRDRHINQFDRDCVNIAIQKNVDAIKYFVAFHFFGTVRDDTEYWRWYSQELEMREFTDEIVKNHNSYDISGMRFFQGSSTAVNDGALCVVAGHHINLYSDFSRKQIDLWYPEYAECGKEVWKKNVEEVISYWKERNKKISLLADKSPTHYEYLKDKIYNQI